MPFIQSISLFILKDSLNYRGLESGGTMKLRDIAAAPFRSEAKSPKSDKRFTVLVFTEGMKVTEITPYVTFKLDKILKHEEAVAIR